MNTNLGEICMELLETNAPQTTANFLRNVDNQSYNNTLVHEVVKGQTNTIVGGAYTSAVPTVAITSAGPLASEFKLANTRGTVAMSGSETAPGSTGGWFINVSDNPALDSGPGKTGRTVFARVIGNGMRIVDVIAKLPGVNLNSPNLMAAPVVTMDRNIGAEDLVNILTVRRYNGTAAEYEASLLQDETGNSANLTDVVCMTTNVGEFCLQLFPEAAPQNVANFLNYVRDGDYDNTFFHRGIPGFVLQGGGFRFDNTTGPYEVPKDPTVINEYRISNTQGTVAMAKVDGNPDSATSEWFINLNDNSANLDNQNGGFTVFAKVTGSGMSVVELIARIGVYNLSSVIGAVFDNVPLIRTDPSLSADDFVTVIRAYETKKDLTLIDDTLDPADPASRVTTLANYGTSSFALPVRVNGKLYQIVFIEQSISPPVYRANTRNIIQLVDNGRPAATLSIADKQLLIPSIRIGARVYTNIELALTDSQVLEFTLVSFDKL